MKCRPSAFDSCGPSHVDGINRLHASLPDCLPRVYTGKYSPECLESRVLRPYMMAAGQTYVEQTGEP